MEANVDYLGKWPLSGKEARREKRLIPITPDKHLHLIHGKEQHVLVSMIVSNDYLNVGLLTVPVNGRSDFETHAGDETLYVIEGELVVHTLKPGEVYDEKSASHMSHLVHQDQKMLIPEGVRHRYLNFTNDPVKVYFAVAPKL